MWIIPLLVIGAIVVAAASKSPREAAPPQRQLPPPVAGHPRETAPPSRQLPSAVAGVPGPISVLGEILRIGQYPSPTVILCAIAEAEAIGRRDLASDIVSVFVAPVVYQHQRANARCLPVPIPSVPVAYERGSCALPRTPRAQADHACAPRDDRGSCSSRGSAASTPTAPPTAAASQIVARQPTEDEILDMLHADPRTFISMVEAQQARRGPVVEVFPVGTRPPTSAAEQPSPPPMVSPAPMFPPAPPEAVAQMQEVAALHAAADQPRAMTPGSPLGGVPDDAWRQFVARLAREPSTFSSSRHVGQYRQRRERLADLGIDPGMIHGSASAQRTALDADLADAYRHASAGGLTEYLGRSITVPGHEASRVLTLSGLLGVIQCAGLDGAVGWLERSSDRKRYPHTTQVFLVTNGVF